MIARRLSSKALFLGECRKYPDQFVFIDTAIQAPLGRQGLFVPLQKGKGTVPLDFVENRLGILLELHRIHV